MLDITRLVSRAGEVLTGVDRVELAYLRRFIALRDAPVFALSRTAFGYILLDFAGCEAILARIEGQAEWGGADRLSRMARGISLMQKRAQTDLRRMALARCRPHGLQKMLASRLPRGAQYFNTGHSNLTDRTLHGLRHGPEAEINVLIHDAIPLEYPQYTRPEAVPRFAAMLRRVGAYADRVIYNSEDTRRRVEAYLDAAGAPPCVVAHLGVTPTAPSPLPSDLAQYTRPEAAPFFVILGTIEPRKNHALLLDIWDRMALDTPDAPLPHLLICGKRGWQNEAVFARLDALRDDSPLRELPNLTDGQITTLLTHARGLLFPSFAEGYGLPAVEAARLGCPVVASDLPVFQEVLGALPVYAEVNDSYLWQKIIIDLATNEQATGTRDKGIPLQFTAPDWDSHFNAVLRMA